VLKPTENPRTVKTPADRKDPRLLVGMLSTKEAAVYYLES
jgi:hypothetical protein